MIFKKQIEFVNLNVVIVALLLKSIMLLVDSIGETILFADYFENR